jgi:hypothetical protein
MMVSANTNEDKIGKAVDLVIAGKVNLEPFKKVMRLKPTLLFVDATVSILRLHRPFCWIKSWKWPSVQARVQHPELMTQEIRYDIVSLICPEVGRARVEKLLAAATDAFGVDNVALMILSSSCTGPVFLQSRSIHHTFINKQKCEIFPFPIYLTTFPTTSSDVTCELPHNLKFEKKLFFTTTRKNKTTTTTTTKSFQFFPSITLYIYDIVHSVLPFLT